MNKLAVGIGVAGLVCGLTVGSAHAAQPDAAACWGQASAVFAQTDTGVMGEHSSAEPTPRIGLRNLARALADAGIIPPV